MLDESRIKLNKEQKEAVEYDQGPLLIIAGAGTGKTTVITERIKWLIQEKSIKPEEILALTFTEKAAQEMEERVDVALPLGYNQTWILTFHGFCERVLRQDAVQIGLDSGFDILTEAETQLLIKNHLFEFNLDYYRPHGNPAKFIGGLTTHFARLKDEDVSPEEYINWANDQKSNKTKQENESEDVAKYIELAYAYQKYEELKIKHSVMDFADLISNTMRIFRERPNVLKYYQQKFKYILLDEFQDSNYAQNHLAILLAGDIHRITAVADDDQSIYRWRGAAVYNVLDFKKHFPKAKIVSLTQNYRSGQGILDAAYQLIQNNNPDRLEVKEKIDKKINSANSSIKKLDKPIQLIWEESVEDEAEQVVNEIQNRLELQPDGCKFSDFAILVRANNHAEPFVRALSRHSIPYQFLGPGRLFKQNEIRELVAYLKFLDNFQDNLALYKVLTMANFAVSGRDLSWLVNQAKKNNTSLFQVLEDIKVAAEEESTIVGYTRNIAVETIDSVTGFVEMTHRHLDLVKNGQSVGSVLYYFLQDTGILKKMSDPKNELEAKRTENIAAFFNLIKKFETRSPQASLSDFVEYLEFLMQAGESPMASEIDWSQSNAVNILTIHSAKGLEFETVFLTNLVNLRFPTTNRRDQIPLPEEVIKEPSPVNDPHIAEERRLFYVGMTRAKSCLYLTGAKFYHDAKRAKKISGFVMEALGEGLEKYQLESKSSHNDHLSEINDFMDEGQESQTEKQQSDVTASTFRKISINYLSFSQIETFQTCPLHYKLGYIIKIPMLPSGALSFGNTIHETLNKLYLMIRAGEVALDAETLYAKAIEIYEQCWSPIGFQSKEHAQQRFVSGQKTLQSFLASEAGELKQRQIYDLEKPFTFNIAPDLKLGGRIDRIDELADGTYEMIDYKTGQKPHESELKNGVKGLQLSIYAMAVSHPGLANISLDKLKLSFYYLEDNEKITFQRMPEELEQARQEILAIREEMQESNFECNGSYICQRGCDYELFCG